MIQIPCISEKLWKRTKWRKPANVKCFVFQANAIMEKTVMDIINKILAKIIASPTFHSKIWITHCREEGLEKIIFTYLSVKYVTFHHVIQYLIHEGMYKRNYL